MKQNRNAASNPTTTRESKTKTSRRRKDCGRRSRRRR
jgi:hypothetical protein